MSRFWMLVILFVILVLLIPAGLVLPIDILANLALGWAFYLYRVVPRVHIDADGVATAAACLALFAVGLHLFASWLVAQLGPSSEGDDRPPRRWKARWTASLVAAVVLMFVAGLAASGVAHQVGWLLGSPEPLVSTGSGMIARRMQSRANVRWMGMGLLQYHEEYRAFPAGGTFDDVGRGLHGWQAKLLPFLEHADLYEQIRFSVPWDDPIHAPVFRARVGEFANPGVRPGEREDAAGYAPSHYASNARLFGGDRARTLADIKDGASQTLMAGEAAGRFKPWGSPTNWRSTDLGINQSADGFGGPYPGGANFVFADGSAHFLRNSIDPRVLKAISTPDGAERVSADSY